MTSLRKSPGRLKKKKKQQNGDRQTASAVRVRRGGDVAEIIRRASIPANASRSLASTNKRVARMRTLAQFRRRRESINDES